jgi:hypothetical protein
VVHESARYARVCTTKGNQDTPISIYDRCAFIDGGTQASTTDQRNLLHDFQVVYFKKFMCDAGNRKHQSTGQGYFKVFSGSDTDDSTKFAMVHTLYAPSVPYKILSSDATVKSPGNKYRKFVTMSDQESYTGHVQLVNCQQGGDLFIPGRTDRLLLWTLPVLLPTASYGTFDAYCTHFLYERVTC